MTENDGGVVATAFGSTLDSARERIIVALDVPTEPEALKLAEELAGEVGFFKVGLELFTAMGPRIIQELVVRNCKVFLDGKFMDIPATVEGASRAATQLGVRMFDVHCLGGRLMMSVALAAAREVSERANQPRPRILGVTILTSVDQRVLEDDLNIHQDLQAQVVHLARAASDVGLDGVIASPHEVARLRAVLPSEMMIVTPGVRPAWAAVNDQKRIATPAETIQAGADFIVVGRPITRPPRDVGTPASAARLIAEEIASVHY